MSNREAMQQALEALIDAANVLSAPMFSDAADALREALAQPEPSKQAIKDVCMIARNAIDKIIELESNKENT